MNLKNVEKKENNMVELSIAVEKEAFEAAIDKAYKKNRNSIAIQGFRKGKAPRKIIEAMYGENFFYEEAVNIAYPEAYTAAVEQEKLRTVSFPEVEILNISADGIDFKATVAIYPEVTLGEYKGLSAVRPSAEASDADVDAEIQSLLARNSRLVSVERPVQTGDTAIIDFEGFDNGVAFEGGKGEKYSLAIGSGSFVPGFEEQLVGLSAGDEKDIGVTFPEDYHENLAGKPVIFKIKIHEVKENELPELDDEFAKDVSEYDTLDELKKSIYDKLVKEKADHSVQAFESALMEQVISGMKAEIPDAMVDSQVDKMIEDYSYRITSQGMPFEDYLNMAGIKMEDLRSQAKEPALGRVRTEVALAAIADAEKIEITNEEIDAEYAKIAEQYSMPVEKLKTAVKAEDMITDMRLAKAAALVTSTAVELKEELSETENSETAEDADNTAETEEKPKRKRTVKNKTAQVEEKGE